MSLVFKKVRGPFLGGSFPIKLITFVKQPSLQIFAKNEGSEMCKSSDLCFYFMYIFAFGAHQKSLGDLVPPDGNEKLSGSWTNYIGKD